MIELNTPPLTFEQVMLILAEQKAETLAKIEADRLETFAKIEADKKLHKEQMQKMHLETFAKIEADKKLHKEEMKEFKEKMENLSRRFGDLGNRLGEIVEYLVTSNLKEKFDKYGFYFRNTALKVEINDGSRKQITDIDVLLYDGDKVMAVEVKTKPIIEDVRRHILRMQQIIQYPNNLTRGMKIYGAIAGAIIENEVLEIAFESGFYAISQTDDNVDIITPPANFVAKYWDVVSK